MTIIAYRDGMMAGDTLISTAQGHRLGAMEKVVKNKFGYLLGARGPSYDCQELMDWFLTANSPNDLENAPRLEDVAAILVFPDKIVRSLDKGKWKECFEYTTFGFTASGCGDNFAMGAMVAGATARGAVEAAIQLTVKCGGEITTVELG
jgi:hypothetical protein